ncbi:hypothetical protein PMIN06_012042 [Paraphaeosphaeria minitans]
MLQPLEDRREQVRRWTQAEIPFSWEEYESIVSLSSPGGTVTPSGISSRMRRDSAKYSVRQLHGMRMNGEEAVLLTERNLDFAVPRCHETHCKLRSPSGLFS